MALVLFATYRNPMMALLLCVRTWLTLCGSGGVHTEVCHTCIASRLRCHAYVCCLLSSLRLPCLQNAPKQAAAAASLVLEASALNRLQHPNVVRVYGFCEKPELMVVMEYCAMGSLSQWIRSHRAECMAVRVGPHACPRLLSLCRRCCPCCCSSSCCCPRWCCAVSGVVAVGVVNVLAVS